MAGPMGDEDLKPDTKERILIGLLTLGTAVQVWLFIRMIAGL